MKKVSGVYEIVNLVNGKRYIGSALNINRRWGLHKYQLRQNMHHCAYLQRAYNKHGEKNFEFNILFECDKSDLLFCEQNWIDFYGMENLYNSNPIAGSCLGVKRSEEFKKKMSVAKIGTKHSEEQKKRMSIAKIALNGYAVIQIDLAGNILGKYDSVRGAAKQIGVNAGNISASVRKYRKCINTMFVKSEEDIEFALQKNREICETQKVSSGLAGAKSNSKPIYQIDMKTNQFIKQWNGISDAVRELGICQSSISECASGKRKLAGGFGWRFVI